jgi:hypothetical protein
VSFLVGGFGGLAVDNLFYINKQLDGLVGIIKAAI